MRCALVVLLTLAATPAVAGVPNETKDCLIASRVQEQRVVDDRTVLFREGSRWYRSEFAQSCQGLDPEKGLRAQSPSGRICSGDPQIVFERVSNFTYGACALGRFTRIDPPLPTPRHAAVAEPLAVAEHCS